MGPEPMAVKKGENSLGSRPLKPADKGVGGTYRCVRRSGKGEHFSIEGPLLKKKMSLD